MVNGLQYGDFFDSADRDRAYASEDEALGDSLRLLDLYLAAACAAREDAGKGGVSGSNGQIAVRAGSGELPDVLACGGNGRTAACAEGGMEVPAARQEELTRAFAQAAEHLQDRRERTRREKGMLRLSYLKRLFSWGPLMELVFLLALGPEYSRKYARAYRALCGDERTAADLGLAFELFSLNREVQAEEKRALLQPEHAFWLCFSREAQAAGRPQLARPLMLRPRIVRFLRGGGLEGSLLGGVAELLPGSSGEVYIYGKQEEALRLAAKAFSARSGRACCALTISGRRGSGRQFLARRLAAHMGRELCLVHVPKLLAKEEQAEECFRELLLETRLGASLICFDGLDCLYAQEELTPQGRRFLDSLAGLPGLFLLLCGEQGGLRDLHCGWKLDIPLAPPGPSEKIRLWEICARNYRLEKEIDLALCGSQYVLNTGEVQAVLRTASLLAAADGREALCREDLTAAVKQHNSQMLGACATRVNCVFNWDDLVVEDEVRRQLEHICNQLKYRSVVADDWGFYRKTPYGRGLCALFYGPPGTGKTMAVQVIANELGLDLYRIDLSQMVSKYIGETEKNISQLFERAKDINALLFFDEADALFARRSEVSDANDRNANAETAHLLQKLEEYEGITILATNLKDNIDDAFRRRIRFMLNFKLPDAETRRLLWKKMFPPAAPLEEDVDLGFFADRFELSGSAIKEIAFNAAYMAAAEHGAIGNRHLIEALRLNFEKLGMRLTREELSYLG